ncbi:MAG: bifunctional pantoate--beta-alanine ligase/(d)CMP kinase [Cyanobacteria bacterium J06597_1]
MHVVCSGEVLQAVLARTKSVGSAQNDALMAVDRPALDAEDLKRSASSRTGSPLFRSSAGAVPVGLVPTMGALHAGHTSLIDRSIRDCTLTVVSIFVNPLQFGPTEDLDRYPRQLQADLDLCRAAGVDIVFVPHPTDILSGQTLDEVTQVIPPAGAIATLCGPMRPGHFEGVLTIVLKLLSLVQPDLAYFGQKDAQQLALIRRMVDDFKLPTAIVGCPIVRDPDGLALSSRNQYLSDRERQVALTLSRGLFAAKAQFDAGERNAEILRETARSVYYNQLELHIQYIDVVHPNTLEPLTTVSQSGLVAAAAVVGQTRLIDNVQLDIPRKPILAIDGPAGAGKSTVARQLASGLGLLYLDTGALYRAVTWLALECNVDIDDEVAVADLAASADIRFEPSGDAERPAKVWVRDREVAQDIRTQAVTANVSAVSAHPMVRDILLKVQQEMGRQGGVVMEGRDIGTAIFPDAELKIFLTATPGERARRRQRDLAAVGTSVDLQELEQQIQERDRKDSQRAASPLRKADDALEVLTDGLTQAQVVQKIAGLYRELG